MPLIRGAPPAVFVARGAEDQRPRREVDVDKASAVAASPTYEDELRGLRAPALLFLCPYVDTDGRRAWELFKPIPGEYYHQQGEVFTVACLCGARPELRVGELRECGGGCERFFLATNRSVLVFGGPRATA